VNPDPQAEAGPRQQEDELARLVGRAERGDLSVLPALREALAANPNLWQTYGDLALQAEGALVRVAAGSNLLLAESLLLKLRALKAELGGDGASPLERLLIARVTATWLQTAYFDGLLAQAAGASEARLKVLRQMQDAAHRRHLAGIKQLAVVRRLLRPAPSPLELLRAPVGETSPGAAGGRRAGGLPRCGAAAGVEN
jgi:hypothetical protein